MNATGVHDELKGMISAYLDNELTQAEAQRVRIHLEDCAECTRTLDDMSRLRTMTASVSFPDPPEDRWEEVGRRLSVRAPRQTGWMLIVVGLLVWFAFLTVTAFRNLRWPEPEEAAIGAIVAGFALLLFSVVRQRWIEYPQDRYRRVKK
jgi:anti-sigma factor RsiW